jgi:hypothetical protein
MRVIADWLPFECREEILPAAGGPERFRSSCGPYPLPDQVAFFEEKATLVSLLRDTGIAKPL